MFDINADNKDDDHIDSQLDNDQPDEDNEIVFEDDEESQPSEDDEQQQSSTFQALRKEYRKLQQELNTLKKPTQVDVVELGNKPKLEDPDIDYDVTKFEQQLEAYYERSKKVAEQQRDLETQQTKQQERAQRLMTEYQTQAKELGAKDFKAMEQAFELSVSNEQGSIILKAAKNKALVVYLLGSKPTKLDALLKIEDPIELAAEVARLEKGTKVSKKPSNIKPEGTVRGSNVTAARTGNLDKQLEKLRAKALETGNFTEVVAFKKANKL